MYLTILFLIELSVLFLLSRKLNQSIFTLFHRLTHSEYIAIVCTTGLLFPGTVVHELSHLFTAEILQVHTGKLTLLPKRIGEDHVQAGSVEVQRTDPFRRTLIGLSPIFVGITVITLLSIQLTNIFPEVKTYVTHLTTNNPQLTTNNPQLTTILFIVLGYLLFAISNNMFSSKEDLHGVTPVLIFIGLVIGGMYAIGFRVQLTNSILTVLESVLKTVTTNLGVVLGINVCLLLLLQIVLYIVRPRRRRIV